MCHGHYTRDFAPKRATKSRPKSILRFASCCSWRPKLYSGIGGSHGAKMNLAPLRARLGHGHRRRVRLNPATSGGKLLLECARAFGAGVWSNHGLVKGSSTCGKHEIAHSRGARRAETYTPDFRPFSKKVYFLLQKLYFSFTFLLSKSILSIEGKREVYSRSRESETYTPESASKSILSIEGKRDVYS